MKFKIYEDLTGDDLRTLDESDRDPFRISFNETGKLQAVFSGWDDNKQEPKYRLTPWYNKHWVAISKLEDALELVRSGASENETVDIDTLGQTAATPADAQLNQKRLTAAREAAAILNDPYKATDIIALADYLQGPELNT